MGKTIAIEAFENKVTKGVLRPHSHTGYTTMHGATKNRMEHKENT